MNWIMQRLNNYDFSVPNRLDVRALWLNIALIIWQTGKTIFPFLILILLRKSHSNNYLLLLALIFAFLVFAIVKAIIKYRNLSFQILGDELIIREGWLKKEVKAVKFDKIHEVNLNQKFIHKLLNLYYVGVDTAGSSKTEISIDGINYAKALAFKNIVTTDVILEVTEKKDEPEAKSESTALPAYKQIQIGLSSLIKIGMTRNYLQTLAILAALGFQLIDQLERLFYKNGTDIYDDLFSKAEQLAIGFSLLFILFTLLIGVVVINLIRTLWTYYNYKIQLQNKQILVSFGLTESHQITVPSNKVQLFQFQQNYFQRLMNLYEINIKQIESKESKKKKMGLVVPGANREELNELFAVIYGQQRNESGPFIRPHIRFFIVRLITLSILTAALAMGSIYIDEKEYLPYIGGLYILVVLLTYFGFRSRKLILEGDFVIQKQGVWDISTTYLQFKNIQQLELTQNYFQRKRGLGNLTFYTAAGRINLKYYSYAPLQQLANVLVYEIEQKRMGWM